jgi:hypothetical protein
MVYRQLSLEVIMSNNGIVIVHLPRQTTNYTCGAACLAAMSKLINDNSLHEEMKIATETNAVPDKGIDNKIMELWASDNLKGAYRGLMPALDVKHLPAIMNIRNPISGVGHYIIALSISKNKLKLYCPYYSTTLFISLKSIEWESGDGKYKKWGMSFNIDIPENLMFISDPCPELNLKAGEPNTIWLAQSVSKFIARHSHNSHNFSSG